MSEANQLACPVAAKIFDRLDTDIRDRRGLKQEWSAIDDDVMNEELRPAWEKIIAEEISRAGGQKPAAQEPPDVSTSVSANGSNASIVEALKETDRHMEELYRQAGEGRIVADGLNAARERARALTDALINREHLNTEVRHGGPDGSK